VKYIWETSDLKISAQLIVDQLPDPEELNQLRDDIKNGTKQIQDIDDVGFIKYHNTGTYDFYIYMNGEKKNVSEFNIFDSGAISDLLIDDLL